MAARRRKLPPARTPRGSRIQAHNRRPRPGRFRPTGFQQQNQTLVRIDTSQLDELGRTMHLSNKVLATEFRKRTRIAGREVLKAVRQEAPRGRTGLLKRRGIRLSVSRKGVFVRIAGVKSLQPTNLFYLVARGHRKRGGGRTSANPFLDRALDRVRPRFQKQMDQAMDDTLKWTQRNIAAIRRSAGVGRGRRGPDRRQRVLPLRSASTGRVIRIAR